MPAAEMTNRERVRQLIGIRDWESLTQMLESLSNMELRRMERMMREDVLGGLENDLFWETLLYLIIFKRAAFISGVTAVTHLAKDETLDFDLESVRRLYEYLKETNEESLVKMCNMMMPELMTEAQVMGMFEALHVENEVTRLSVLLKAEHDLSYYLIFKTLKMIEDKVIARKCCTALMKRQDDRAFNAVCLIKAYFGLDELPARFSLTIEQYELSHIDRDYNTFCHVLEGKRPRV
ncbi:MAG: hypothetical protein J6Y38_05315 [Bacteroidaceae bacterium]|nr:hypothetical protein [Bacteroidaceae bacterium]